MANMRQKRDTDEDAEDSSEASSGMGMKWLVLLAALGIAAMAYQRLGGPGRALAGWTEDWEAALEAAERTSRPMLVLFTADWCPPCRQLKSEVLTDADVAEQLSGAFTLVKVDLTERGGPGTETARTYDVRGIPTLLMFDSHGRQVDRISGFVPADHLLQWIETRLPSATRKR